MEDTKCKVEAAFSKDLKKCTSCFRVKGEDGRWQLMGDVSISSQTKFIDWPCPDCCKKMNLKEFTASWSVLTKKGSVLSRKVISRQYQSR